MSALTSPIVRSRKLLLADDDADTLEVVSLALQSGGHEVSQVMDGFEAVKMSENYKFDAVILDLTLPRMNGFEVAARIRQDKRYTENILVAYSGRYDSDWLEKADASGFDFLIPKPADVDVLLEVVIAPRHGKGTLLLSSQRKRSMELLNAANALLARSKSLAVAAEEAIARSEANHPK